MDKINEIDLKKEESNFKKNIRYKRLKNLIIALSLIATIIFLIIILISKNNEKYNKMEIYSKLNPNGNIEIKEEIKFFENNSDYYTRIIPYNEENIKNLDIRYVIDKRAVKAKEITKEQYDKLDKKDKNNLYYYIAYINNEDKLEDSNIKDKIIFKTNEDKEKEEKQKEQQEKEIEQNNKKRRIVIYIPKNKEFKKTKTATIGYSVSSGVKKYKDVSEMEYKIIDSKDENYLKNLKLEMEFPNEGIRKEEAKAWFFGIYDGNININSNKIIFELKKDLKASEGLKIVSLFVNDKLDKNIKAENKEYKKEGINFYNNEFDKQNKFIESEIKRKNNIVLKNNIIIYISAAIFAALTVKISADIINEISYRKDIESVIKSFKYYNNPPEEFKFNFTKIYPLVGTSLDNVFKSIFLKLIYKGLIIPKKQKKLFSLQNYNILSGINHNKKKRDIVKDLPDIEYTFLLDEEDYIRQEGIGYILPEDKYVYDVLKSISNDNEFNFSELNEYLKKNYKPHIEENLNKLVYLEKKELLQNGYFDKDTNKKDLNIMKQKTFNIFILLIFLSLSIIFYKDFKFPIYISIFTFLIYILNSIKYKIHLKGINAKGLQAEAQIIGFRNFLRDSSLLDLKSDNKKDINFIRQYLMYSVFFGISDRFIQKSTQYNDVNFRKIYKDLEIEEEKLKDKDLDEEDLNFKYGDCQYVLKKIQESINISKTYYATGFKLNETKNKIYENIKNKKI